MLITDENVSDSLNIKSLFVPLDGSEWHERAIGYGLLISRWFGSTIDLFFSLADVPPLSRHGEWRQRAHLSLGSPDDNANRDESIITTGAIHEFGKILANDYLNEITQRLHDADVEIETDLSAGSPAHILSYKAQQAEDSMIVMYARPQNRLRRYVRKKMAEELLSVTTVPVLMVNDDPDAKLRDIEMSPESLIVPLRVESAMRSCLPYAVAIANKARVGIRLLESKVEDRRNRKLFNRSREFTFRQLDASGVEYSIQANDLGLTEALSRAHRGSPFSWIVMGSRMRYGLSRKFLPSVADNVRREVSCPVLAVPQGEIIAKREDILNRWLIDWLAHQDPASSFRIRSPVANRPRSWTRQLASLYTYHDSDRKDPAERPR